MYVFTTHGELRSFLKKQIGSIGLVPTMGALHKGHLSLVQKAAENNNWVLVSIFINPTQFNNQEDLVKYPKTYKKDTKLLENVSCDVLFFPSVEEIYANNVLPKKFNFDGLEHQMEGKFREGHFNGVGTIVKTLFEVIEPNNAYFGEKDFQQLKIIKIMVKKHHLNVKIKGCKIFREEDGLAMSSRNSRLNIEQRTSAPFIYRTLKKARDKFETENTAKTTEWVQNQFEKHPFLDLEYFTIADEKTLESIKNKESDKKYRAFIAVFAGEIRLIDNIRLK